jgi:Family of unknown function (DUF5678)
MAPQPLTASDLSLDRVYELLHDGAVDEVRQLLDALQAREPDSAEIADLARKLAPPRGVLRAGASGKSRARERAWLCAHAREYRGCWIAVTDDSLVAADRDYGTVLDRVSETVGVDKVVLYFQP